MLYEVITFREQTKAVGHAVRANYLYAGAADVYAETGDQSLMTARITSYNVCYTKLLRLKWLPMKKHNAGGEW